MRVAIGADTNGQPLMGTVRNTLEQLGAEVVDLSGDTEREDYPDIAWRVSEFVAKGEAERAILVCGTGLGMSIVANKVPGIRAALAVDPYSVRRSILSNNVQVLTIGAEVTGPRLAAELIQLWMSLTWQGGPSARKVDRISKLEESRGA
jgi:ribose 5-phosphate isomerase B